MIFQMEIRKVAIKWYSISSQIQLESFIDSETLNMENRSSWKSKNLFKKLN